MIESTLAMQMGYYNSSLALWEPLIEPVEVVAENVVTYHPWELKLDVSRLFYLNIRLLIHLYTFIYIK